MSDYKVIKLPQDEFEKLEGYVWAVCTKFCYSMFFKERPTNYVTDGGGYWERSKSVTSVGSYVALEKCAKHWQTVSRDNSLIKFEQLEEGEFTLDMLESGKHFIKLRDGAIFLWLADCAISRDKLIDICIFDDNLLHKDKSCPSVDIVEVYKGFQKLICDTNSMFSDDCMEMIWKRPEKSEKDKKIEALMELNAATVRDMENLKAKQKELQEKIEDILMSVG